MVYAAQASVVGQSTNKTQSNAKEKTKRALSRPKLSFKQRCFLPRNRGPWITFLIALVTIHIGIILCIYAFHSPYRKLKDKITPTGSITDRDIRYQQIQYLACSSLGPLMVGVGLFTQVMSVMALFVERDRLLKALKERLYKTMVRSEISRDLSILRKKTAIAKLSNSAPLQTKCDETFEDKLDVDKTLVGKRSNDVEKNLQCISECRHCHLPSQIEVPTMLTRRGNILFSYRKNNKTSVTNLSVITEHVSELSH